MKKLILSVFIFFSICLMTLAANSDGKLTTCEQSKTGNKPMVVMYSADYCFYCKKFKPVFYHLSYNLSNQYNFVIYDITKKHQPTICDNVDLDSIPTIYVINQKTGDRYIIPDRYYSRPDQLKNVLLEYYKNLK